jgi:hypothetical protein
MREAGIFSQSDKAGNEKTQPLPPSFIPVNVTLSLRAKRHVRHVYKYAKLAPKPSFSGGGYVCV